MPGMTCRTSQLFDFQKNGVIIAININFFDSLYIAGSFSFNQPRGPFTEQQFKCGVPSRI